MNNKAIRIILLTLIFVIAVTWMGELLAQCPMCRMSAESNLQHGGTEGKGLNRGILYMFAMPYLLVSTLGYLWWKNSKKEVE